MWAFVCVGVKAESLGDWCSTKEVFDPVLWRTSRLDLAKPCKQAELTVLDDLSDLVLRDLAPKGTLY